MIFVTVGTQLPFPRLTEAMNDIAEKVSELVLAQTCDDTPYDNLVVEPRMSVERYADVLDHARVIVGHAGIGTVLAAQQKDLPVILVPRRAELGEHRNDHQIATARQLLGRDGIQVAWSTDELPALLAQEARPVQQRPSADLGNLITTLRDYIR